MSRATSSPHPLDAASVRVSRRRNRTRPAVSVILVAGLGLVLSACSAPSRPGTSPSSGGSSPALSGEITVLAAASLTESFDTIGAAFTVANPQTVVTFSYGSSATLATQVTNGAPADVFAAANETTMDTVEKAGLAVGRIDFASNVLEIAVPAGNPAKISGLTDFADESKKIILCAEEVPCGSAAIRVFALAKITPKPDSYEADVKAALSRVTPARAGGRAEADAALVYATDVRAAGDQVEGIAFPDAQKAANVYPITSLSESENADLAAAFVAYVLSPKGQKVLTDAGFSQPEAAGP